MTKRDFQLRLVRNKNKMSLEYYKEIIRNYRAISDKLNFRKVDKYLKLYKNEDNLSNIIWNEVLQLLNFEKLIEKYTELGYQYKTASSLAGQDVFIYKLFKSKYKDNITLKGGVIMHSISNDKRRTTRDIDLDLLSILRMMIELENLLEVYVVVKTE